MAYLQLYANGALVQEHALVDKATTIGRSPDCNVRIDNPGVSELHARIRFNHGRYIVEDAMSRNGILLNGHEVDQKELAYGDEIDLPKHRLVFVEHSSGDNTITGNCRSSDAIIQDETMEVDISFLQRKLQDTEAGSDAHLMLQGAIGMRQQYPISKVSFTIGKSLESDIYLNGWFAPAQAAKIQRRSDGYYVYPERRGKVRVNDRPIQDSHKLVNGDGLQVRNMRMSFRQQ
jgi:predicted component of type VI protein secretion system